MRKVRRDEILDFVTFTEWPGGHTWRYWSTHVRESLAWMARRVGG